MSADYSENAAEFVAQGSSGEPNLVIPPNSEESKLSVIQYYGSRISDCGYCGKSERQTSMGRRTYDMHTYRLTAKDYQLLLDRNWRRSGNYSYYPINNITCCPNYPITCEATKFHLTRSQRKCIEKLNSYLTTGEMNSGFSFDYVKGAVLEEPLENTQNKRLKTLDELKLSTKLRDKRFLRSCERKVRLYGKTQKEAMESIREKWNKTLPRLTLESYLFPNADVYKDNGQSIKPKHILTIDLTHVQSQRCVSLRTKQHEIMVRYQKAVHKEDEEDWPMSRFCDFLVNSPMMIEPLKNFDYLSEETAYNDDTFSCDLYSETLLGNLPVRPPQLPTAYGTYHCNYILDDRLIAISVLDVLPNCITTVYFFYDPEFSFLNLGIYSALIEISLVRRMDKHFQNSAGKNQLVYYHMGFYVPECKKMHYKTRFKPSYLLCSKTYRFVPLELCQEKLLVSKYVHFDDNKDEDTEALKDQIDRWLTIPIEPPVANVLPIMMSYVDWLQKNFGLGYVDIFFNGYLSTYASLIGSALLPRLKMRLNEVHLTLTERQKRLTKLKDKVTKEKV